MYSFNYQLFFLILVQGVLVVLSGSQSQNRWSKWSNWSKCSVTCGYGTRSRSRQLISHPKEDFTFYDIIECWSHVECPVHGQWGMWSSWGECPVMCNGGLVKRERQCNEPEPRLGGKDCFGAKWEGKECNKIKCPLIPANFTMTMCKKSWFMCESKKHCVPAKYRCDNVLQCHDGTDEKRCYSYVYSLGRGAHSGGGRCSSTVSMAFGIYLTLAVFCGLRVL